MSTSKVKRNVTKVSTPGDSEPEDSELESETICDNELTFCDNNLKSCADEQLTIDIADLINPNLVLNKDVANKSTNEFAYDINNLGDITIIEPKRPTDLFISKNNETCNATKNRFYESDDAIISQIFSQTITSAGVTPTDECDSFMFEQSEQDSFMAVDETVNSVKDNESKLSSEEMFLNQTSSNLSKLQQPSIVIDSYEENGSEPCYIEPITPNQVKSYFDTTIIPEDETKYNVTSSPVPSPTLELDQPIPLTDIEVYKSLSTDDHSLTRNGNVVDITQDIYVDTSLVTSDSDETGNSYGNEEFDSNCDKIIPSDEIIMVGFFESPFNITTKFDVLNVLLSCYSTEIRIFIQI